MADPKQHYCPTEAERLHREYMRRASEALLHQLTDRHPRIVQTLQQRAQQRSN
jgi:hypothetical protein